MLKCNELVADADALLDGALPPVQRLRLRLHLLLCRDCRRYLRQLRLMLTWLGRCAGQASDGEVAAILRAVDGRRDSP